MSLTIIINVYFNVFYFNQEYKVEFDLMFYV